MKRIGCLQSRPTARYVPIVAPVFDPNRTLRIEAFERDMDDDRILGCFGFLLTVEHVKVKANFALVQFKDRKAAEGALQRFSGAVVPDSHSQPPATFSMRFCWPHEAL